VFLLKTNKYVISWVRVYLPSLSGMQTACAVLCHFVACLALPYLPTLSCKGYYFRGGGIMSVFRFSLQRLSPTFLILIIIKHTSPRKASAVPVIFEWKLGFSQKTFEKSSNSRFHENPSSGSRDIPYGQTDSKKLIVTFRTFTSATKNVLDSVTNWESWHSKMTYRSGFSLKRYWSTLRWPSLQSASTTFIIANKLHLHTHMCRWYEVVN
jgi:hypothetical protein